ncbi:unnamed protein product [Mytilus coruscus]|uniref:Integrase catalytic domain-containing protein n=1 Tax=Mytilus coruscus TaxID=42192 RepID=A0A6J8AKU2_MYTCO|nr:unnamed protein product [Mytilus coruscus]
MMKRQDYKRVDFILKKIYYDLSTAGAYLGPDKLYQVLKAKGVKNVGKHSIRSWLQNQDNYSLQKPARKTFEKAKVVVAGIDDQFDADLADLSSLSKENGDSEDIYYFTTQNSSTKANIAERVIQTIKNMMFRYFTKQKTHCYIDVLQDIVKSYNATPHRSLNNIAPKDVKLADIWAYMYLKPRKMKSKRTVTPYHYKRNDIVRLSHKNMIFDRSYDEHFTREIFKISQRMRMQAICVYVIKDFMDQPVRGHFYECELQRVNKDEDALWFIHFVEKKIKKAQTKW